MPQQIPPDAILCHLTKRIMQIPVLMPDGYIYDYEALQASLYAKNMGEDVVKGLLDKAEPRPHILAEAEAWLNTAKLCSLETFLQAFATGNVLELEQLNYLPAYLDHQDERGLTLLHKAVIANQYALTAWLLNHRVAVNTATKMGLVPLHLAVTYGYVDIVNLLIAHQAKITLKTPEGFTSLHLAARQGNVAIASLLCQHAYTTAILPAFIMMKTKTGVTALTIANIYQHKAMEEYLLGQMQRTTDKHLLPPITNTYVVRTVQTIYANPGAQAHPSGLIRTEMLRGTAEQLANMPLPSPNPTEQPVSLPNVALTLTQRHSIFVSPAQVLPPPLPPEEEQTEIIAIGTVAEKETTAQNLKN